MFCLSLTLTQCRPIFLKVVVVQMPRFFNFASLKITAMTVRTGLSMGLILALQLPPLQTWGETGTPSSTSQSDYQYPGLPVDSSSAGNRIGKILTLEAQLLSISPAATSTSGLSAGFFLTPDNIISLGYASGSGSGSGFFTLGSESDTLSTVGVSLKHFFGNSFYGTGSLNYQHFTDTRTAFLSGIFGSNPANYSFTGDSVRAGVSIGNQWQWSNFTLGCDWVGVSVPLTTNFSAENVSESDPSDTSQHQNRASAEKAYVSNVTVELVAFYLGVSF